MSDPSKPAPPSKLNGQYPTPAFEPRKRRKGRGAKTRRRFTAAYKLKILKELDELDAKGDGQVGEILRREGLYSSQITTWRQQRDRGTLSDPHTKRGRKPQPDSDLRQENRRLKDQVRSLEAQLAQAKALVDVQKKLCSLLDLAPAQTKAKRG